MLKQKIFIIFFVLACHVMAQKTTNTDSIFNLIKNTDKDTTKIRHYLELSKIFMLKDLFKMKDCIDNAYSLASKLKNDSLLAGANGSYGSFYSYRGDFNKSLEYYLKALEYYEKTGNNRRIATLLTNIGSIYYMQKNYQRALTHYERSLKIINEFKTPDADNSYIKSSILNNIANVYRGQENLPKSTQFYKDAFDLAVKKNLKAMIGNASNNLGEVYMTLGKPDSALYFLNIALKARQADNDQIGMARSYKNLGRYYLMQNSTNLAIESLDKGLACTETSGEKIARQEIFYLLSNIYQKQKNFEKAFFALKSSKSIDDTLFSERISQEVLKKEMEYEFDKKERIRQMAQEQREYRFILLAAILSFLLVIAILFFILARSRNQRIQLQHKNLELEKQNLEKDLELKNKELTTNIMYLVRNNELINDITDRLLKLKNTMEKENQKGFQSIIYDLQAGLDNTVWKDFEFRFQQVHNDFYEKLHTNFPDLTPAETKLCAFLKLNLASKEIAAITHQNIKSIEVARSRLRKKLNINNQDINLVSFLMDL